MDQLNDFRQEHAYWRSTQKAELAAFQSGVMHMLTRMAVQRDPIPLPMPTSNLSPLYATPDPKDHHGRRPSRGCRTVRHPRSHHPHRKSRALDTGNPPLSCDNCRGCICHDTTLAHTSPRCLSPFLGNPFLLHSLLNWYLARLSSRTQHSSHQTAKSNCVPPSWRIAIAVAMKIVLGMIHIQFCLQTQKKIPENLPILCFITVGR